MKHRVSSEQRQESLDTLRAMLPMDGKAYVVSRGRSRSGSTQRHDVFALTLADPENGRESEMFYLSGHLWNVGFGSGRHPNHNGCRPGLQVGEYPDELIAQVGQALHGTPRALRCEVL